MSRVIGAVPPVVVKVTEYGRFTIAGGRVVFVIVNCPKAGIAAPNNNAAKT